MQTLRDITTVTTNTPDDTEDGAQEILKAVAPDAETKSDKAKLTEIKELLVQMQDVFEDVR